MLTKQSFDDDQCYQVNSGNVSKTRQSQFSKSPMDPQGADLVVKPTCVCLLSFRSNILYIGYGTDHPETLTRRSLGTFTQAVWIFKCFQEFKKVTSRTLMDRI